MDFQNNKICEYFLNTTVCEYDGGDCICPEPKLAGDGKCDEINNFENAVCDYDGGDCCPPYVLKRVNNGYCNWEEIVNKLGKKYFIHLCYFLEI